MWCNFNCGLVKLLGHGWINIYNCLPPECNYFFMPHYLCRLSYSWKKDVWTLVTCFALAKPKYIIKCVAMMTFKLLKWVTWHVLGSFWDCGIDVESIPKFLSLIVNIQANMTYNPCMDLWLRNASTIPADGMLPCPSNIFAANILISDI